MKIHPSFIAIAVLFAVVSACDSNKQSHGQCTDAQCASACIDGETVCKGKRQAVCTGGLWIERACDVACVEGHCVACHEGDGRCTDESTAEVCREGRLVTVDCGSEGCREGSCTCPPYPYRCTETRRERCEDGTVWVADACPSDLPLCLDGECLLCQPGSTVCQDATRSLVCSDNGKAQGAVVCAHGCDPSTGTCIESCSPGEQRCRNRGIRERCRDDGRGFVFVAACDAVAGDVCAEGFCVRSCDVAAQLRTPAGCRFDAPLLHYLRLEDGEPGIALPASHGPSGIHLVNSDPDLTAHVVVRALGQSYEHWIPPGERAEVWLPVMLHSTTNGSLRVSDGAISIESSVPVTAIQSLDMVGGESPVGGGTAFLLPAHLLGTRYRILTTDHQAHPHPWVGHDSFYHGGFSVAAVGQMATIASITFRGTVCAGPGLDLVVAGTRQDYELAPGEVVHFLSCGTASGTDRLTGTLVEATHPTAVFTGGVSRTPSTPGHHSQNQQLEQLMPVDLWGDAYALSARRIPRADGTIFDQEQWVVVADQPSVIDLVPTAPLPPVNYALLPGDAWVFHTSEGSLTGYRDFTLTSDAPVMVGRYLYAEKFEGSTTFVFERPTRFWRSELRLVSVGRSKNRIALLIPDGSTVMSDGVALAGPYLAGPPGYQRWEVPVEYGLHVLQSTVPFGAIAYGYELRTYADKTVPAGTIDVRHAYSYSGPVGFGDSIQR